MRLIVGLGNPGRKYQNNRHNVGFWVVEALANKLVSYQSSKLEWEVNNSWGVEICKMGEIVLVKPTTFMNDSGRAVKKLVTRYLATSNSKEIGRGSRVGESLYIVHDDLDIKLGEYKIQKGKGPKLHYGLQSIEDALGTEDFWRIRVGVDNRNEGNRVPGEQYVLEDFEEDEQKILADITKRICMDITEHLLVNKFLRINKVTR